VLLTLLMPVVLTGLSFLTIMITYLRQVGSKFLLTVSAVLLMIFGVMGILSIWQFYLPIVLKLAVSVVIASFSAVLVIDVRQAGTQLLLWVAAILLLGFCLVAIFSAGIFYLPAAIALIVSSAINSDAQPVKE